MLQLRRAAPQTKADDGPLPPVQRAQQRAQEGCRSRVADLRAHQLVVDSRHDHPHDEDRGADQPRRRGAGGPRASAAWFNVPA